jgi:hypothetical protein
MEVDTQLLLYQTRGCSLRLRDEDNEGVEFIEFNQEHDGN